MTKITETTGLDASRKLLEEMGFEQAQHILPELLEQAVKDNASFSDFLERLLRKEREYREERRVKTSLKLSGLPCGKTLENFDFTFQRSVGKKEIELLATCEYVRRKENVFLLGPPGVGKSHLAAALGDGAKNPTGSAKGGVTETGKTTHRVQGFRKCVSLDNWLSFLSSRFEKGRCRRKETATLRMFQNYIFMVTS
jgi:chromosomal replication initiation ATPase DnaA